MDTGTPLPGATETAIYLFRMISHRPDYERVLPEESGRARSSSKFFQSRADRGGRGAVRALPTSKRVGRVGSSDLGGRTVKGWERDVHTESLLKNPNRTLAPHVMRWLHSPE